MRLGSVGKAVTCLFPQIDESYSLPYPANTDGSLGFSRLRSLGSCVHQGYSSVVSFSTSYGHRIGTVRSLPWVELRTVCVAI